MGRAKERMMELQERGYGDAPDTHVCEKCFGDDGLIEFIRDNGEDGICSYCGQESDTVCDLESVVAHIVESVTTEWMDAADSGTPYESREGGYQGKTFDTYDLLMDEEPIEAESHELFVDIVHTINVGLWAREFVMPYEEMKVENDWDVLVDAIKHHARFVIFHDSAARLFGENFSWHFGDPRSAIKDIARTIERLGMVRILPRDTPIYRARCTDIDMDLNTACQMGTVPYRQASQSNRMSPAGIPMFYGALTPQTARAEIGINDRSGVVHCGTFYPSRDLVLIDFTEQLYIPSIYSQDNVNRSSIRLMRGFVEDFSRPISRDNFEHVEYIPTQVITEYLRLNYLHEGDRIDGILFNSAQHEGVCCVLFVDNEHCVGDESVRRNDDKFILLLREYTKETV
jgi:hypothetical protein